MTHSCDLDETRTFCTDLDVSVVMACYTEDRLASIDATLTSLRSQTLQPRRVIVAVDNNEPLATYLSDRFDWITVVRNRHTRGASGTRNCGVEVVETPYTAFIDDDEAAEPDWLLKLVEPFDDETVVGTGGKYEPKWLKGKPSWFPDEFTWAVGGSYLGQPTSTSLVRNVWSGNMAVRTKAFRQVGGFRTDFGKCGVASQPEDTDLCIRMAAATGEGWMYVPSAVIHHDVPKTRSSLRFFLARCYAEGFGKALMRKRLALSSAVDVEHDYVATILRVALHRLWSRAPGSSLQGFVMLLGLASAAAGYLVARLGDFAPAGVK